MILDILIRRIFSLGTTHLAKSLSPKVSPTCAKAGLDRFRRKLWCCSMLMLLCMGSLEGLLAQDSETTDSEALPWEKGSVQFGGLVALFNSEVTFGLDGVRSGHINGEDLLGLDSSLTVFRADALYRPGSSRRNQLDFTYAAYDRSGSATLSRDLAIGQQTFPVGARVDTVLNFDLIRGTYSYAFVQNKRARIALGLGVYGVPLKYDLEVETFGGRSAVEGANTTLPLPALGLRAEIRLWRKLFLMASVDGMYLEISDFRGSLIDANLDLEYRVWKHLGFGLGYNFLGIHAEGESQHSDYPGVNFLGSVDVRYSGLLFYGKVLF